MTEGTDGTATGSSDAESTGPAQAEAIGAVGAYEDGGDVVLYDTENPLAWVQADDSVDVTEMA